MKRLRQRYVVILGIFVGTSLSLPALLDRPRYQTYVATMHWELDTPFIADGQPDPKNFPSSVSQSPGVGFWRNYSPQKGVFRGEVRSSFFVLRSCELIVPVVGFPNSEDAGIYVESEAGHQRFPILYGATHEQWQPFTLLLPKAFINNSVRIVAYSKSARAYIGVGTPYYRTNYAFPGLAFSKLFVAILLSVLYLLILFFPAFSWLQRFRGFAAVDRMLASLLLTSLLSLPLFFLAFYFPPIGRLVVYLWVLLSTVLIIRLAPAVTPRDWSRNARHCLVILIALTVFQALFLFSFNTVSVHYVANYLFYPASWSTDNQIPTTTARLLAHGTILSDWPFGSWRLSDRTPLLASLLYPAAVMSRGFAGYVDSSGESLFLQIAGFGMQNCWILPVWIIFRRLRFRSQEFVIASLLFAATPFIFFNTVYLWPKLLTATFCVTQFLYLVPSPRETLGLHGFLRPALGGTAAGMAILSHAGSAVASAGVFVVAICLSHGTKAVVPTTVATWERLMMFCRHWRWLIIAALVTVLVLSPWLFWTKFGFPTSNPLPKYFLTGGFGFENPNETVVHAVLRFYRTLTIKQWLLSKSLALKTLGGFYHGDFYKPLGTVTDISSALQAVRAFQFFYLLPSLGLFLIPITALACVLRSCRINEDSRRLIAGLGIAAIISFALQFVMMISPHVLHHYPYFVPFALHLVAVIGTIKLRAFVIMRLSAALNYLAFVFWWIVLPTARTPVTSVAALVLSLALVLGSAIMVLKFLFDALRPIRPTAIQA